MNAQIICLLTLISADASPQTLEPHFLRSLRHTESFVQTSNFEIIRGQTPTYDDPTYGDSYDGSLPSYQPPGNGTVQPTTPPAQPYGYQGAPAPTGTWNPFTSPPIVDPFQSQPMIPAPYGYGGGYGGALVGCGVLGPQPYRFGWTTRADVGYLPRESLEGGVATGRMGVFEVNTELRYTYPLADGWIMSLAPQFNYRDWDGPDSPGLPGSVYRIGGDIELATPAAGPWSLQLGFNPSVNTDFEENPTSDAWNFDGRGALFWRTSPQFMWVLGAAYWDRVNAHVIPYAGFVWNPIDIWEWRLVFPNPRVSVFLGNIWGVGHWLYVTGEYHIEAYEIVEQDLNRREQIELEDWRALIGLRTESAGISSFVEAGWVFGRDVEFLRGTPGFDISSGFIARLGLRY